MTRLRCQALQMLTLSTVFWALSFPLMKALTLTQESLLPGAGSWFISSLCVAARFLAAGLLLLAFSLGKVKSTSPREWEQGLLLAFFASSGLCFQMDGLAYVSASTSAFLTQLYCVLIPLWVAVSHRRFPGIKVFLCSGMVLFGMALLVKLNPLALRLGRGELETLISSVLFAAQILCLEHPRYTGNRPQCITTIMLLAMGLFALPLAAVTAPSWGACARLYYSAPVAGLLLGLVLICSLSPFLLMNRWQREVTATEAGLVYCAEPVFVCVLALFLPAWLSHWTGVAYGNEPLTSRLLIGGGLITAANVLLQSPWLEERKPVAASKADPAVGERAPARPADVR